MVIHVLDSTALIDYLITAEVGWSAGRWRSAAYAARGVTLWQADCLVAATAAQAAGVLVTGNPEDFPMGEVQVDHWPVGS